MSQKRCKHYEVQATGNKMELYHQFLSKKHLKGALYVYIEIKDIFALHFVELSYNGQFSSILDR